MQQSNGDRIADDWITKVIFKGSTAAFESSYKQVRVGTWRGMWRHMLRIVLQNAPRLNVKIPRAVSRIGRLMVEPVTAAQKKKSFLTMLCIKKGDLLCAAFSPSTNKYFS